LRPVSCYTTHFQHTFEFYFISFLSQKCHRFAPLPTGESVQRMLDVNLREQVDAADSEDEFASLAGLYQVESSSPVA
jgi:hypothetical protein